MENQQAGDMRAQVKSPVLYRIFNIVFAVLFYGVLLLAVFNNQQTVYFYQWPLLLLCAALGTAVVFAASRAFLLLPAFTVKSEKIFVLAALLVFLALQLVFGFSLGGEPLETSDFGMVYTRAADFVNNGNLPDNYFLYFGTHTGIYALLCGWFSLFGLFGMTDFSVPLMVLNTLAVCGAVVLMYFCARRLFGVKKALFILAASVFVLPFLMAGPAGYANTFTLPAVAGIVLLWMKTRAAWRQDNPQKAMLYFGVLSAVAGFGALIKMTVLIIWIAAVLDMVLLLAGKGKWRVLLAGLGVVVAIVGLGTLLLRVLPILPQYDRDADGVPLNTWVMMGLRDEGGYNQEDMDALAALPDKAARRDYAADEIGNRLRDYMPLGLFAHLGQKLAYTFGEPTLGLAQSLDNSADTTGLRDVFLPYGNGFAAVAYIAFAIQAAVLAWAATAAVKSFVRRNEAFTFARVALFGLVLFLMIWKADPGEILNYLPLLLLCGLESSPAPMLALQKQRARETVLANYYGDDEWDEWDDEEYDEDEYDEEYDDEYDEEYEDEQYEYEEGAEGVEVYPQAEYAQAEYAQAYDEQPEIAEYPAGAEWQAQPEAAAVQPEEYVQPEGHAQPEPEVDYSGQNLFEQEPGLPELPEGYEEVYEETEPEAEAGAAAEPAGLAENMQEPGLADEYTVITQQTVQLGDGAAGEEPREPEGAEDAAANDTVAEGADGLYSEAVYETAEEDTLLDIFALEDDGDNTPDVPAVQEEADEPYYVIPQVDLPGEEEPDSEPVEAEAAPPEVPEVEEEDGFFFAEQVVDIGPAEEEPMAESASADDELKENALRSSEPEDSEPEDWNLFAAAETEGAEAQQWEERIDAAQPEEPAEDAPEQEEPVVEAAVLTVDASDEEADLASGLTPMEDKPDEADEPDEPDAPQKTAAAEEDGESEKGEEQGNRDVNLLAPEQEEQEDPQEDQPLGDTESEPEAMSPAALLEMPSLQDAEIKETQDAQEQEADVLFRDVLKPDETDALEPDVTNAPERDENTPPELEEMVLFQGVQKQDEVDIPEPDESKQPEQEDEPDELDEPNAESPAPVAETEGTKAIAFAGNTQTQMGATGKTAEQSMAEIAALLYGDKKPQLPKAEQGEAPAAHAKEEDTSAGGTQAKLEVLENTGTWAVPELPKQWTPSQEPEWGTALEEKQPDVAVQSGFSASVRPQYYEKDREAALPKPVAEETGTAVWKELEQEINSKLPQELRQPVPDETDTLLEDLMKLVSSASGESQKQEEKR